MTVLPNFTGLANNIEKGGAGGKHVVLALSLISLLPIFLEVVQYFFLRPS